MSKTIQLGLYFGALCPSISEQIKEQLNYADDVMLEFDKDADAITRLYGGGIITDSEKTKAHKRLTKQITKYLNGLKRADIET